MYWKAGSLDPHYHLRYLAPHLQGGKEGPFKAQLVAICSEFRGGGANRKFHATAMAVVNSASVTYMTHPQPASHEIACESGQVHY